MILNWLPAIIVFNLPGLLWLAFSPASNRKFGENFITVFGISSAFYTLLFLSTYVFRYKLSETILWSLWGLLLLVVVLKIVPKISNGWASLRSFRPASSLTDLVFILLFVGILILRFYQIKDLVLPAWVDSLHHVLIVRILLEQKQIPLSLKPYVDVPFYYHFGFHTIAAIVAQLTNLSPEKTVLYFG